MVCNIRFPWHDIRRLLSSTKSCQWRPKDAIGCHKLRQGAIGCRRGCQSVRMHLSHTSTIGCTTTSLYPLCRRRSRWWTAPADRGLGRESGCYRGVVGREGGGVLAFIIPCSTFPSSSSRSHSPPLQYRGHCSITPRLPSSFHFKGFLRTAKARTHIPGKISLPHKSLCEIFK